MNSSFYWDKFKEARNFYNNKIKEAKVNKEVKQAKDPQNPSKLSPKKWWKLAKSFVKKDNTQNSLYPPINYNNQMICDDQEKADTFNKFFLTHFTLMPAMPQFQTIPPWLTRPSQS